MKKIAYGFLIFVFFAVFNSKAYCGFLDDVKNKAKESIGQAISDTVTKANKGNPSSTSDESKLTYVELSKGMYGIPFGAKLQEVLKWCEENKVNITNPTKEEIEKKARYTLSKIRDISKAYNIDKEQFSEMEKEVLKLTMDEQMDAMEKMAVSQAEKILEDLKSGSFNYKGKSYLLNREFRDGESVTVEGIEKVCIDKRITNMIYSLEITPSDISEKLINNSLSGIRIFFKRDDSGNLTSYATVAIFQDSLKDVLVKQYNSVFKVLSEKYGNPVYREKLGTKRNELHPTYQGVTYSATEDNTPEGNIYHLTGIDFLGYDALLWKKNVILITKFRNNDLSTPDASEEKFYVIYYESNTANSVLGSYEQAIRDFRDSCSKEDIKKESQMKENF